MKRLRFKILFWSVSMICLFLESVEPSIIPRAKSMPAITDAPSLTETTFKPIARQTHLSKDISKNKATTVSSTDTTTVPKLRGSNKKKSDGITTTTTISPLEIMNRLYQMHGLASHGISVSHANYQSEPPKNPNKKKGQGSSLDDIYQLHALAIHQGSSKRKPDSSSSSEESTKFNLFTQGNSMENVHQQHSSLPSSMNNIISQHSVSSKPQKVSSSNSQESPSSKFSTLMQPFLKQLTPVGAGIGVVLAPLLLFNGFLQFFSNMSRFLNNFAQTILPTRRPPTGQSTQNQNEYFQNLGAAYLKRQPREWYMPHINEEKISQATAQFMKALKAAGQ